MIYYCVCHVIEGKPTALIYPDDYGLYSTVSESTYRLLVRIYCYRPFLKPIDITAKETYAIHKIEIYENKDGTITRNLLESVLPRIDHREFKYRGMLRLEPNTLNKLIKCLKAELTAPMICKELFGDNTPVGLSISPPPPVEKKIKIPKTSAEQLLDKCIQKIKSKIPTVLNTDKEINLTKIYFAHNGLAPPVLTMEALKKDLVKWGYKNKYVISFYKSSAEIYLIIMQDPLIAPVVSKFYHQGHMTKDFLRYQTNFKTKFISNFIHDLCVNGTKSKYYTHGVESCLLFVNDFEQSFI
ncbi:MAG: hypothetical protein Harvfovirus13_8 [Harvfovirus sp.]|uniref:Uncharacterized protein n=1 Tax=Harvfovirus sp. TaxID=2487768 RepID=A0A3G5A1D9_9VIRU|nr:MAG: hypothetical protein Harvfovirus13_8 [Harvfovirus sp.]